MKTFIIRLYIISLITSAWILLSVDSVRAVFPPPLPSDLCKDKIGVLVYFVCDTITGEVTGIKASAGSTTVHENNFEGYINAVLEKYFPFILFIAMIMIVFSGVQYMLSGFDPNAQKLAKQRILGILGGLIFYLLIQLILNQLLPKEIIGGINTTP